jgi:hypothetical protein
LASEVGLVVFAIAMKSFMVFKKSLAEKTKKPSYIAKPF